MGGLFSNERRRAEEHRRQLTVNRSPSHLNPTVPIRNTYNRSNYESPAVPFIYNAAPEFRSLQPQTRRTIPSSDNAHFVRHTSLSGQSIKVIRSNPDLKTSIFEICDPTSFTKNYTNDVYSFVKLGEGTNSYQFVRNKLSVDTANGYRLNVTSIEKVENSYTKTLFEMKKYDLKAIYGHLLKEQWLFHGTQLGKVDSICKHNFNHRLSGTNKGHLYGHGISFSPRFFYSCLFTHKEARNKVVFLCNVITANVHVGNNNTLVPLDGFDTTKRENNRVIVKYDDDVFYPAYKITFDLHKFNHNCY